MIDYLYNNEVTIRLSVFLIALTLLILWEWKQPKRVLTQNKFKRWFNNIALVVTGTLLVRVLMPMTAIGAAYTGAADQTLTIDITSTKGTMDATDLSPAWSSLAQDSTNDILFPFALCSPDSIILDEMSRA